MLLIVRRTETAEPAIGVSALVLASKSTYTNFPPGSTAMDDGWALAPSGRCSSHRCQAACRIDTVSGQAVVSGVADKYEFPAFGRARQYRRSNGHGTRLQATGER